MPVTPFHYPVAYLLHKLNKNLSLPGLIVGAFLPDIEVPLIILLFRTRIPNRLVLHSLLGAITIGTVLTMIITIFLYPLLVSRLFKIDEEAVKDRCRFSGWLWVSCALGILSHVLLDVVNHLYNPIFFPIELATFSLICFALGGSQMASLVVHSVLTIIFILIIVNERGNLRKGLLVG